MTKIYLDHAATTPMRSVARDKLFQLCRQAPENWAWTNSSSTHSGGMQAKGVLEQARDRLARLIGAQSDEIYFTGSATEANNWVLHCFAAAAALATDHSSITVPVARLHGLSIGVDSEGSVDFERLRESLAQMNSDRGSSFLLSAALINNETGVIQDIAAMSKLCKDISRDRTAYIHADAAQAPGYTDVDVRRLGVDYLTLSSHKSGGPKGIAALYARRGSPLRPLLVGGGHERGERSGTVAVELINAFVSAAEEAVQSFVGGGVDELRRLRNRLIAGLTNSASEAGRGSVAIAFNHPDNSAIASPHIVSLTLAGIPSSTFVEDLNRAGVMCSAGSACKSSSVQEIRVNPVLRAMGREDDQAHHIRMSLGHTTTAAEIDLTIGRFTERLAALVNEFGNRIGRP